MKSRFPILCLALAACLAPLSCRKAEKKEEPKNLIDSALEDFEDKKYGEALAKLQRAETEHPSDPFVLNLIGAAYTKQKDYGPAKTYFEKSLAQDPNFFPARFNVGELMFLQKQYPQALGFFTQMLSEAPANELLQFKVVLSLLMTNQDEDAKKLAARMRFPGDGPAWYYAHAAVEHRAGNKAKARDYLAGARAFFPNGISLYEETFQDLGWPTK